MMRKCAFTACFLFLLGVSVCSSQSFEYKPLNNDPAALLKWAAEAPPSTNADSIVLLEYSTYKFDADGRLESRYYLVGKILTQTGIDQWQSLRAGYAPWHQERPQLNARVINVDGSAHVLDQKTIAEAPIADDDDKIYSDERLVRAPLPAMAVGSVVEEEIIVRDTSPSFDAGNISRVTFGSSVPTQSTRITLDYPKSLPIQYEVHLLPQLKVDKQEVGDRVVLKLEQGPMPALEEVEPNLPGDVPRQPSVEFSSGTSWQSVATRYSELVDAKVKGAEVKAFVEKATRGGASRDKVISSLISQLHKEIRYTGIEFGQSALIPHPPSETLKHKFGDCKDKSALLVAMLRDAGIPAYLALLSTGPGEETPLKLAGMGTFGHAIVYVPGSPDYWIDATAEYSQLGEIPSPDQGRLALIVKPETTGLQKIPELPSTANRVSETREVYLPEFGYARIVEITQGTGDFDSWHRHSFGGAETKDFRKNLEQYVKEHYLAESLSSIEKSQQDDLTKPFQIRLEATKAKRGNISESEAVVVIPLLALIERLPEMITSVPGDPDKVDKEGEAAKYKRRKNSAVLPMNFSAEWKYQIFPPQGFRVRSLPAVVKQQFGPAVLSREFVENPDKTVSGTFRLDTVKRNWSAEEVEAARKAVREFKEGDIPVVYFDQEGQLLVQAGKVREALDVFASLSSSHPKEALHHTQAARALLAAGLGDAAREEARLAVKLEPVSAQAQRTLAWILEHDLVGRRMKPGFDHQGAEAAYRKAMEIDPEDTQIRASLAILLEYDTVGIRYSSTAKLNNALAEYGKMTQKQLQEYNLVANPLFVMLWSGHLKELRTATEALPKSATRNALLLAAIAGLDGTPAAIAEATNLTSDNAARSTLLLTSGQHMIGLRKYPEAVELFTAATQGSANAGTTLARIETLRKTHPYESNVSLKTDPKNPIQVMFTKLYYSNPPQVDESIFRIFSKYSLNPKTIAREVKQLQISSAAIRNQFNKTGMAREIFGDLNLSNMQVTTEGDDTKGYRMRVRTLGSESTTFFVIREDGEYRILENESNMESIGNYLIMSPIAGNIELGRQWLDWAREDQKLAGGEDPFAGRPFPRFWTRGQQATQEQVRYAAAALAATGHNAENAIPVLLEGREKATESERTKFDIALMSAYSHSENFAELRKVAERLVAASPESESAFWYLMAALRGLKLTEQAEKVGSERLSRMPADLYALRELAHAESNGGNPKKAIEWLNQIVAIGKAEAGDLNQIAWYALEDDNVTPEAVETARKASEQSQNKNGAILHTLAALYADVGKSKEARELLLNTMESWSLDEPNGAAWYVFGRIAEQYGVQSSAIAAYKRVERPEQEWTIPGSSFELAQRRLKILEKSARTTSPPKPVM